MQPDPVWRSVPARAVRNRAAGLSLALMLALAGAGCSGPAAPANSADAFEFTYAGDALGPADVGFDCSKPCAAKIPGGGEESPGVCCQDAVALPDGRIRLYFNKANPVQRNTPFGIESAISSDGVHFTVETGDRIPVVNGMNVPMGLVYGLPDGGYRLFYTDGDTTVSATSPDGLTFTNDPGVRLAANAFAEPVRGGPACTAIVPLADGRYRMYCSQVMTDGGAGVPSKRAIFSAVSSDLLAWTPEPGVRLGPGSDLPNDAGRLTVLRAGADRPLLVIYHSYNYDVHVNEAGKDVQHTLDTAEVIVQSPDGLAFSDPVITGVRGSEVAYAQRPDGRGFLYYAHEVGGGPGFRVAEVSGVASGPAINLIDPGPAIPAGSGHGILVSTAPGGRCSIKPTDAHGAALRDKAFEYEPVAGADGLIVWALNLPKDLPAGPLTSEVTCSLDGVTRTRKVSFDIGQP